MNYSWDLTKLFKDENDFLNQLEEFKKNSKGVASFEGKLNDDEKLKEYIKLQRYINEEGVKLYRFASMRSDLDKREIKNSEDLVKVQYVFMELEQEDAFSKNEILTLGEERFNKFFTENPEYKDFDFTVKKIFLEAEHVLDGKSEKLISNFASLDRVGAELYSQLSVADYKTKKVTLSDDKEYTVSQSNWISLIEEAKSASDREKIFKSLYSYYDERKSTYGQIYNTVLQTQLAEMKSKGYKSILESHLHDNNIPVDVFHTLIEVASTQTKALQKYYELRRKYLGLEKHRSYDRFLKLAQSNKKYTYEEALDVFYKSIDSFPEDFKNKAREVTKEGYVDVYPQDGKRTGAYSSGGENIHPFILLNFQGGMEDCFTLAHESGHSIHTMYTMENQPVLKQDYTIFVAEIASTFNEHNLLDYMIESGSLSKEDKIVLLQKSIDQICSTFYRQALFAHFEYNMSLKAERNEPINYQVCNNEMINLYKQYYNIDITEEELKPFVWAYIPHLFYTPFYVYQYATSFTASMLIYEKVKNKEEGAFDKYISLLKSGGSEYPIDQVKKAGVDLTKKESFLAVSKRMEELVDKLEELLKD